VRQIEVRAFEKVQKAVKNNIAHMENVGTLTDANTGAIDHPVQYPFLKATASGTVTAKSSVILES
jgi:hypothetical protein